MILWIAPMFQVFFSLPILCHQLLLKPHFFKFVSLEKSSKRLILVIIVISVLATASVCVLLFVCHSKARKSDAKRLKQPSGQGKAEPGKVKGVKSKRKQKTGSTKLPKSSSNKKRSNSK